MVEFVTGPAREMLLTIELLIVFIFIEISIFFIYRYWTNKKNQIPSVVELDWAILFGCFGVAFVFYTIADFFAAGLGFERPLFITLAYLSQVIGGVLFLYHLELARTIYTGYKLTIFACSFPVIFIFLYFFAPSIIQTAGMIIAFFAFAVIFVYFLKLISRIWKFYKLHSLGLFTGIFLWVLGIMGNTDMAGALFGGFDIRIIGDSAIISGIVIVAFFVTTIPSLDEIGWREKVKYIMITTQSGVCLYNENFQERAEINEILISGALWGIQVFLKNIIKDANLKVISKGTDVILMEQGDFVTGILVVEQDLKLLRYLLRKLILQFEFYYGRILLNWNKQVDLFRPTKQLINHVFAFEKK